MLFNSLEFVVFFPIVVAIHFVLPYAMRQAFLLAASYLFYMAWEPGYVALILVTTVADFLLGLLMQGRSRAGRRGLLAMSLTINLGLLFFFKYFSFFSDTARGLLAYAGWKVILPHSPFLLPVGISFYTFQSLSYIIDVYRGRIEPEKHPGLFALYVAFFPQLVAGPIERAYNLLPQLKQRNDFDYARVTNGLKLMAWGLFKKAVVADRLAQAVDFVYANPAEHGGPALAVATVFFAFQIYCDFSGYSDIAIGAAQVLGIRIMENFRQPYGAATVADFWRRWHISLSTWFRDYLYIPLGGNRVTLRRWTLNILIVFLLSGLWHGASWTFAVWGLLHGAFLAAGRLRRAMRGSNGREKETQTGPLAVAATFLLVTFAWIFFRAQTLSDAWAVCRGLPREWPQLGSLDFLFRFHEAVGLTQSDLALSFVLIGIIVGEHALQARGNVRARLAAQPGWVRWTAYSVLLWAIFLLGVFQQREFIYFVF